MIALFALLSLDLSIINSSCFSIKKTVLNLLSNESLTEWKKPLDFRVLYRWKQQFFQLIRNKKAQIN